MVPCHETYLNIEMISIVNFDPYQVSDISAFETRTEVEGRQKLIEELQRRLADAESKLIEGEKLRKKLHNTILVFSLNLTLLIIK